MKIIRDNAARQEAIYSDRDELLVEAGAGTGKTSVLVSKIVHLIKDCQVRIQNIAAITFTESSAQELSERIRLELKAELGRSGDNKALSVALLELEQGTITTIHGFAQSILMRYGDRIGIPLNFTIADESIVKYQLKNKLTAVIYEMLSDRDRQAVLVLAQSLGLTDYHLNTVWQLCNENWYLFDTESSDDDTTKYFTEDKVPDKIAEKVQAIGLLANSCYGAVENCTDSNDKLFLLIKNIYKWNSILADKPGLSEVLEWISLIIDPKSNKKGNKKNWPGTDINYLRGDIEEISLLRKEILQLSLDSVLPVLVRYFAENARKVSYQRKLSGELRFQDLLVYCRELLMENIDIREKVISQYYCILVDEFQDTDQIQLDIVNSLSAKVNHVGSKLFYVGDPKQSIYRFRGADIGLYRDVRYKVSGNTPLEISTNFRSRPKILDTVNKIFMNLLQANGDIIQNKDATALKTNPSEEYPEFHPLLPARGENEDGTHVMFLGGVAPEDLKASERRYLESEKIAAIIKEALDTPWLVEDHGQMRPAALIDIAVIIPQRTGLLELKDSLKRANISYSLPSSELVFSNLFVQDFISCLKAIIFPYKQYYLLGALRSIVFGCSDTDLIQFRIAGGQWIPENKDEAIFTRDHLMGVAEGNFSYISESYVGGAVKVYSALQKIYELHNLMHEEGIISMLGKLIDISNLYAIARVSNDSLPSVTALDYVVDKILIYCKKNNTNPYDLVDFIEAEKANSPRAELFKEVLEDNNSINIVTIHGSKGLEYPICILAELGGATVSWERPAIIFTDNSTGHKKEISVRINEQIKTSGYDDASNGYDNLERAELYRLCYVAFTRARDHLVVMLDHKPSPGTNPSLAQVLYEIVSDNEYLSSLIRLPGPEESADSGGSVTASPDESKINGSKTTFNRDIYTAWQNRYNAYREQKSYITTLKIDSLDSWTGATNGDIFNAVLRGRSSPKADLGLSQREISSDGQAAFDAGVGKTVKKMMLCAIDKLNESDTKNCLFYNEENRYFNHDPAEMVEYANALFKEHLLPHVDEETIVSEDMPIIFEAEGLTFEGEIDIYSKGTGGLTVFDCGELIRYPIRLEQPASLSDRLNDACLRLGAYALGLKQLGLNAEKFVMLYSPGEKDYRSAVFEDIDALIGLFSHILPYWKEKIVNAVK